MLNLQKSADGETGHGEDEASDEENLDEEQNWTRLGGEVIRVSLQPNDYGLGISLAGEMTKLSNRRCVCLIFLVYVTGSVFEFSLCPIS